MKRSGAFYNLVSVLLLALTAMTVLCYLTVLVNPHIFFNPFPPGEEGISGILPPTATPTRASVLPPTFTPTNTPTITPTSPPTPTRTPTKTPTITPTWPPTPTSTPRATRSPYPFMCEVTYRRPEYDRWSGVAGQVQDMDGNPLPGYYFKSEGAGLNPPALAAGADPRINDIYGNEAAWEQAYNASAYQAMEIHVQLYNDHPSADGSYRPVSNEVTVQLRGYASASLGYVVCTLNWEDW